MSSVKIKAQLQRLEYGKHRHPNGHIYREEHTLIGVTPGFPSEIFDRDFNEKISLGIGSENDDNGMVSNTISRVDEKSGVVIRPYRHNGKFGILGFRIGRLPEGISNRPFQAVRCVFDDTGLCSPGDIHRALEFENIDRYQAVTPVDVPVLENQPQFDPEHYEFFDDFARLAMTAVPIEAEATDEASFFALADGIWNQLPQNLRPFFSMGYNVTPQLAETLSLSRPFYDHHPTTPSYSVTEGEWVRAPSQDIEKDRLHLDSLLRNLGHDDKSRKIKRLEEEMLLDLPSLKDESLQWLFRVSGKPQSSKSDNKHGTVVKKAEPLIL